MRGIIKKVLTVILITAFILTSLVNCSGKSSSNPPQSSGNTKAAESTAKPSGQPEPIDLPIVKQPLTLSYFARMDLKASASLKDYSEMPMYKEFEKRTGIKLNFRHPPIGKEDEQFNLMWASRDYPDMIFWENWLSVPGGPQKAIDDKLVIPINDLLSQYGPNFTKLMAEEPQIKKSIMTDSGVIYGFPLLRYNLSMKGVWGFLVREDWLNKLNLKKPRTIDDWYVVLKAIKEKDPNGNGKNDEIPFSSMGLGRMVYWLYAYGLDFNFFNDNGKVRFGPYEPAYKDALTTLNKWYKEGLLDPEYASNDAKKLDAAIQTHQVGTWFGETGGATLMYVNNWAKENKTDAKVIGVEYPVLKEGDKAMCNYRDMLYTGVATAISTSNKHVKESMKYLDYGYSKEGNLLQNFGIEGESYTMADGKPKFTENVTKNPKGLSLDQALASYCAGPLQGPFVMNKDTREQRMLFYPFQRETLNAWDKAELNKMLPPITPSEQESRRLGTIMSEVNTYKVEMFNKFVMGLEPLTNYDKYLDTLKKMGIEEALKIQQTALDRFTARK